MTMTPESMREIANAVLYEGYLLYPYRRSALKNRQRWSIGVVYPRAYSEASAAQGGHEPWTLRAECLITGDAATTLRVTLRCLHLLTRSVIGAQSGSQAGVRADGMVGWAPDSWEEGMEREVAAPALTLADALAQPQRIPFTWPAARLTDPVDPLEDAPPGQLGATILREQQALAGALTLSAAPVEPRNAGAFRLTAQVENTTPLPDPAPVSYSAAMPFSLVSAHLIVQAQAGALVSLLDPPEALRAAASACHNVGVYPVLLGDEGEYGAMLCSPIILYDYPQIAPESAGALFDGTEIDEILTLRILALSDAEKAELRHGDARAREIMERTEALTPEQMMKLHGVIRSLGPAGSLPASVAERMERAEGGEI